MSFLPEEVETQEFLTAVRGYDKQAVRRFLTVLANQMRDNEAEVVSLQEEIAVLRSGSAGSAETGDVAKLTADLRAQLSLAERLVQDLRTWREGRGPAPQTEPTEEIRRVTPTRQSVAPAVVEPAAVEPAAEEPDSPPAEWEELFVDPTEGRE